CARGIYYGSSFDYW
nr:immunoglobulin heavy chain junction region [Mus musculus]